MTAAATSGHHAPAVWWRYTAMQESGAAAPSRSARTQSTSGEEECFERTKAYLSARTASATPPNRPL
eukprot:11183218-Alexandrium_andersonii.AAC.1